MTDQPDPREVLRHCVITEDELSVILDYHRSTIMAQQYESVALRTHSTSFLMRAYHAVERLKALDPAAWQRVDEELEREMPGWIEQANAEEQWEIEEATRHELIPDADDEWTAFIACVEEPADDIGGRSRGTLTEWKDVRPF